MLITTLIWLSVLTICVAGVLVGNRLEETPDRIGAFIVIFFNIVGIVALWPLVFG
jgi:hypothetical protein